MSLPRTWQAYPASYRANEMAAIVRCVLAAESGSLIGLPGAGKSNLLGYLCHRPDVLCTYVPQGVPPIVPVLVDLQNLPSNNLSTLFRAMLRALYEARTQLAAINGSLAQTAERLYRRVEDKTDPFLSQSALRESLTAFRERDARLALVLDPFDAFCRSATAQVLDNVRGLRDSYKDSLAYIVGLRKELAALRDPAELGGLYEILDTHQCLLGAMEDQDARWVIRQVEETTGCTFSEPQIDRLISLSGAYPSLLRATSLWLSYTPKLSFKADWTEALLAERSVQYRLEEVWSALTEEQHQALFDPQRLVAKSHPPHDRSGGQGRAQPDQPLERLAALGLCERLGKSWSLRGELMSRYVHQAIAQTSDTIWLHEETGELYRGQVHLADLTPLEYEALCYLVTHPHVRHSKTDLILNIWPEEPCPLERTDDSVYQLIRGLRSKIEPDPSNPCYIVTWRGTRATEGGYRLFPHGK